MVLFFKHLQNINVRSFTKKQLVMKRKEFIRAWI